MTATAPLRFRALDIFRGLTICFMIIVNTGGANPFSELRHAKWNGFTLTDLVFPSFLFAVGNAISFSKSKWDQQSNREVLPRILKRTLLLFLIGYLMYWLPFVKVDPQNNIHSFPIGETRIFGVLQRIALCYGIGALMIRFLSTRGIWIAAIGLLLGYWIILLLFGDYTVSGAAGTRLDVLLLTNHHLYIKEPGRAFDPEGILSTLPAVVNVLIGYLAGRHIKKDPKSYEMLARLAIEGFLLLAAGYLWNLVFPVNKKLWTSSFVCLTTGLDCLILATILYIVDFKGKQTGARFFEVFGMNALFIYLFSEVVPILLSSYHTHDGRTLFSALFDGTFGMLGSGHLPSLLWAVTFMLICWLVGYLLYRRRFFIKL
ncbi:acyltransferase family protein [Niabella beijingensis]|uniref:acyltransferase family protein n=1 Tax=Niabella beijingensis TaxID=2872700 RepID=UPI001CC1BF74|nr:heparan-alpha-glucosaminide N-acetyltransferase domain-containing protein [Niabella beijingensis]MBZ4191253.1 heparan-alpha-glucosaminide N-acetyltransferase domain-containing protein [Niabella beijingensis]